MKLLYLSLLSMVLVPLAGATSITYAVEDGNTTILQFVTGNFIPDLPEYMGNPVGGNLAIRPGEWNVCVIAGFPALRCFSVNIGVTFGLASGVIDYFDDDLGTPIPTYLGNFNTDLLTQGTFTDVHIPTRRLIVADGNNPVTFAPEPSTWAMGCIAVLLLFLGKIRRKSHFVRNLPIGAKAAQSIR